MHAKCMIARRCEDAEIRYEFVCATGLTVRVKHYEDTAAGNTMTPCCRGQEGK